jgi:hypothetical protein
MVISRRHLRLGIALLLPLLALRALLPAGYMPIAGTDGVRIVMCSEGVAGLFTPADDGHHPQPSAGEACPFAHAALNAPPPQLSVGFVPLVQAHFLPFAFRELPPAAGPPRQRGARAPPAVLA